MKIPFTFHAQRDFWLGGFQAILRLNGREVWRSFNSFGTRTAALRAARAEGRDRLRRF